MSSSKEAESHLLSPRLSEEPPSALWSVCSLCLSTFYFGYVLCYFSAVPGHIHATHYGQDTLTPAVIGIILALPAIGAIFGSFIPGFAMKAFSKRKYLLLINFFALEAQLFLQIPSMFALVLCRLVQGVCIANFLAVVPGYINDITPSHEKGHYNVYPQLFVVLGVVVSFGIGLGFNLVGMNEQAFWRICFGFNILVIGLQTVLLLADYVPESPSSLIAEGKKQAAVIELRKLNFESDIQNIMEAKDEEVTAKRDSRVGEIKVNRKAFFLLFQLLIMCQFVGGSAYTTFAGAIMSVANPTVGMYTPFTLNVIQLVATSYAVFMLHKMNRRTSILTGNLWLGFCNIGMGIFFALPRWMPFTVIIYALFAVYSFVFGLTLGPMLGEYLGEIVRSDVGPAPTILNWVVCSITIMFVPPVMAACGNNPYLVFWIFGLVSLGFYLVNKSAVVETRNKSPEEIDEAFAAK